MPTPPAPTGAHGMCIGHITTRKVNEMMTAEPENKLRIYTNNVARDVIYGYELSEAERAEFDYLDWSELDGDGWSRQFARYKGQIYDLGDFMTTSELSRGAGHNDLSQWDGYASDSYFSGIVIRYERDERGNLDSERVIFGWYCC